MRLGKIKKIQQTKSIKHIDSLTLITINKKVYVKVLFRICNNAFFITQEYFYNILCNNSTFYAVDVPFTDNWRDGRNDTIFM